MNSLKEIKRINDKAFRRWYRKLSKRDRRKYKYLTEESYNPSKPMTYGEYKRSSESK